MDSSSDRESEISDQDQLDEETVTFVDNNEIQQEQQQKIYQVEYIVKDTDKTTSDMLTKFELASLIGKRAKIIETTGIHRAKNITTGDNITAIIIAQIELLQKQCPFILRRKIGNRVEQFDVNNMTLPNVNIDVWEYIK